MLLWKLLPLRYTDLDGLLEPAHLALRHLLAQRDAAALAWLSSLLWRLSGRLCHASTKAGCCVEGPELVRAHERGCHGPARLAPAFSARHNTLLRL